MALEVRPPAPLDIRAADTPSADEIRSLPGTLEWLRRNGLLLQTDVEVSGDLELTGVQKHLDGSLPLLFDNVVDDTTLPVLVDGADAAAVDAALRGRGVPATAFTAPVYVDFDGGGYRAPFAP